MVDEFEIRKCSSPSCGLRLPINPAVHHGEFCPRCGEPLRLVVPAFSNQDCLTEGFKPRPISVLLENVRSAYNVGAIFRTADGAGVRHIYLGGITPTPEEHPSIAKTALDAQVDIPWSYHPDAYELAAVLKGEGHRLIALECTQESTSIFNYRPDSDGKNPPVLIVGNEKSGVDPGLIGLSDEMLALPMVGRKSSLNVAVAFGVAVYQLSFV